VVTVPEPASRVGEGAGREREGERQKRRKGIGEEKGRIMGIVHPLLRLLEM